MKPGTDCDPHEAFLRVRSESEWAGNAKGRKSQSSLKIEVDWCPLYSASRTQKARAHSCGEAEYYAAASAASEAMLIREVLWLTGLEVRTELLLDSAPARGICRREGVGTIRHLSTKVLWLQQLVKRGLVTVGACSSAENRADVETRAIACPPTATAEAMERPGVRPKRKIGDLVTKRMAKTRMSSGRLQCELSQMLGKGTEESWTHWGTW